MYVQAVVSSTSARRAHRSIAHGAVGYRRRAEPTKPWDPHGPMPSAPEGGAGSVRRSRRGQASCAPFGGWLKVRTQSPRFRPAGGGTAPWAILHRPLRGLRREPRASPCPSPLELDRPLRGLRREPKARRRWPHTAGCGYRTELDTHELVWGCVLAAENCGRRSRPPTTDDSFNTPSRP